MAKKKREIGEEWEEKKVERNIITLIIEKGKISYRGFHDSKGNSEFTGSQTGSFNLSGKKLIIPKSLDKYTEFSHIGNVIKNNKKIDVFNIESNNISNLKKELLKKYK